MIKAIFYKEWIKTKWVIILGSALLLGSSLFLMFNFFRVVEIKGMAHMWEVMIHRDAVFVDKIQYLPVLIAMVLAIAQFAPEMYHKCLKLTLHLPFDASKMIASMLGYGFTILTLIFAINALVINCGFYAGFTVEMLSRMALTSVVWYIGGITTYFLTSWIVLEPTWKRRIANGFISALCLKVFYFPAGAEAYNDFIPYLLLFMVASSTFAFLSVARFKVGKQD